MDSLGQTRFDTVEVRFGFPLERFHTGAGPFCKTDMIRITNNVFIYASFRQ